MFCLSTEWRRVCPLLQALARSLRSYLVWNIRDDSQINGAFRLSPPSTMVADKGTLICCMCFSSTLLFTGVCMCAALC